METQTQNEILPNAPTSSELNYYSNEKPKTRENAFAKLAGKKKKIHFTFPLPFPALLYGTLALTTNGTKIASQWKLDVCSFPLWLLFYRLLLVVFASNFIQGTLRKSD